MAQTAFHPKGWGNELWLINNDQYCGKILTVMHGRKCSIHYHEKKLEHFFILKGKILFEYAETPDGLEHLELLRAQLQAWLSNKRERVLQEGDIVEIPRFHLHRFTGLEDENQIIEISTTHFEEDSHRIAAGDSH